MKAWIVVAVLLVSMIPSGEAWAENLRVQARKSAILPSDETGVLKVALLFDLSGLRSGDGREMSRAYVEWDISGLAGDRAWEFAAYEILGSWDVDELASGRKPVLMSDQAASEWEITPLDYQRTGGLVRLDISELAERWSNGTTSNCGIVVALKDISVDALIGQVGGVRLIVSYGFHKVE